MFLPKFIDEMVDGGLLNTAAIKYCALLFCLVAGWGYVLYTQAQNALSLHTASAENRIEQVQKEMKEGFEQLMEAINTNHLASQILRRIDAENDRLLTYRDALNSAARNIARLQRENLTVPDYLYEDRDRYTRLIAEAERHLVELNDQLQKL